MANNNAEEKLPLIRNDHKIEDIEEAYRRLRAQYKTYPERWCCLFLYTSLCLMVGLAVNVYCQIPPAAEQALLWNEVDTALIPMWQPLMSVLAVPFISWAVDYKGLRLTCLYTSFVLSVGCGIPCLFSIPALENMLFHLGQILISSTVPVVYAVPTVFSSTWFPPGQRTSATATATVGNGLGLAFGSILGPLVIDFPTSINNTNVNNANETSPTQQSPPGVIKHIREEIMLLMFIHFAVCLLLFLLFLRFFPSKPPTPPDDVTEMETISFRKGMRALIRNPSYWILAVVYASSSGLLSNVVLSSGVDFSPVTSDQQILGWISFAANSGSAIGGLLISRFADCYSKCVSSLLITLFITAVILFTWFTLMTQSLISATIRITYGQDECKGIPDGTIVNAACRAYTTCIDEKPVITDCWKDGLVFNEEIEGCDKPENTPEPCCCERDCTGKADGNYADLMTECKAYYTCYNELFYGHQWCVEGSMAFAYILVSVIINSTVPVFLELACGVTQPLGEGLTNGIMNMLNFTVTMTVIIILQIPSIGTYWINWLMVLALGGSIPLLVIYKPPGGRNAADGSLWERSN